MTEPNQSLGIQIVRRDETLMMDLISDVFQKKEGFWVEKRSDISQYFLYIDILRQFRDETFASDTARHSHPNPSMLVNMKALMIAYPDRYYEYLYSFLKIQLDLLQCKNRKFKKFGPAMFIFIQLSKAFIYSLPLIIADRIDFPDVLVYQLIVLTSLSVFLLVLCILIITFVSRTEAILKMKHNDRSVPYEQSYRDFIFNDRLTHSLSDGLSWFFILNTKKSILLHKINCCQEDISSDFINGVNKKYEDLEDNHDVVTLVHNAKWKVANNKAYKSLNSTSFDIFLLFEIFISLIFNIIYAYYLYSNFDFQ